METTKRILSAFLALVMVFGMIPAPAYAQEAEVMEEVIETVAETQPAQTEPAETEPAETEESLPPETEETQPEEPKPEETQETQPAQPEETEAVWEELVVTEEFSEMEEITDSDEAKNDGTVEEGYEYHDVTTFAELKELLNTPFDGHERTITWASTEDLVISESVTLPYGTRLYNYSASTKVAEGATFAVEGSLELNGLEIAGTMTIDNWNYVGVNNSLTVSGNLTFLSGCGLYLENNAACTITGTVTQQYEYCGNVTRMSGDCTTIEALITAVSAAAAEPRVTHEISAAFETTQTLSRDLTIPANVELNSYGAGGLTIAQDVTLTLNMTDSDNDLDFPMTVSGTLENNHPNLSAEPITFTESGTYTGTGILRVNKYHYGENENGEWVEILDCPTAESAFSGLTAADNVIIFEDDSFWNLQSTAGKTQLSKPVNLKWHYNSMGNQSMGAMYWEFGEVNSNSFDIDLWKKAAVEGEADILMDGQYINFSVQMTVKGRHTDMFQLQNWESGTYYFTITTIPDLDGNTHGIYPSSDYYASETVRSEDFVYTKPQASVGTVDPASVDLTNFPTVTWSAPAGAPAGTKYIVESFMSEDGGQNYYSGPSTGLIPNTAYEVPSAVLGSRKIWFTFRIRAMTPDMTQHTNGEWSEELKWNDSGMYVKPLTPVVQYDPANVKPVDQTYFTKIQNGTSFNLNRTMILTGNYTIPKEHYLFINEGGKLVIPSGKTLTVNGFAQLMGGTIEVQEGGTLKLAYGMMARQGALIADGTVTQGEGLLSVYYMNGEPMCKVTGLANSRIQKVLLVGDFTSDDQLKLDLQDFATSDDGYQCKTLIFSNSRVLPSGVDILIPNGYTLDLQNQCTITIPQGVSVVNNGSIAIWNGCKVVNNGNITSYRGLNVYGTLENNSDIQIINPAASQLVSVFYVSPQGTVNNNGTVDVDREAVLIRDEGSTWNGGLPFAEIMNSLAQGNLDLTGNVCLNEDYTIPAGKYLCVMSGGKLTIPAGVTLTVNGDLIIQGGTLVLEEGADLNLNRNLLVREGAVLEMEGNIHYADDAYVETFNYNGVTESVTGLYAVPSSHYQMTMYLTDPEKAAEILSRFDGHAESAAKLVVHWELGEGVAVPSNITIPDNAVFHIKGHTMEDKASLTVPENGSLVVYGELHLQQGSEIVNNGMIYVNRYLNIMGKLTNNGGIHVTTPENARLDAFLGVQKGGEVVNNGIVRIFADSYLTQVKGSTWTGDKAVDVFKEFKAEVTAAAKVGRQVELNGETIVLAENMTIPANVNLRVVNRAKIVVPAGRTLTLNSQTTLLGGILNVAQGGKLVVNQDIISNNDDYVIGEGEIVFAEGVYLNSFYNRVYSKVVTNNVEKEDRSLIVILDNTHTQDEVTTAQNVFQNEAVNYGRVVLWVQSNADLNLPQSLAVPENGVLWLEGKLTNGWSIENNGQIYVNQGATLTNANSLKQNNLLQVDGTLRNTHAMTLKGTQEIPSVTRITATGAVINESAYGSVAVWTDAELICDGSWTGTAPACGGGYIEGAALVKDLNLAKATKGLKEDYYAITQPVRLTDTNVTMSKGLDIQSGSILYIPSGTTLNINGGMYINENATVIVEEGGKLVNNSWIEVGTMGEYNAGLQVYGEYSQKDYAYIARGQYAGMYGVSEEQQVVILQNPDILALTEWIGKADSYHWISANVSNLTIGGEALTIPANMDITVSGTMTNTAALTLLGSLRISPNAVLNNQNNITARDNGTIHYEGTVNNTGTITLGLNSGAVKYVDQDEAGNWFYGTWLGNAPILCGGWTNEFNADWAVSVEYLRAALDTLPEGETYTLDKVVYLHKDFTIDRPMTIGENGALVVDNYATLTISAEVTVSEGGDLTVGPGAKLAQTGDFLHSHALAEEGGVVLISGANSMATPGYLITVYPQEGSPNVIMGNGEALTKEWLRAAYTIHYASDLLYYLEWSDYRYNTYLIQDSTLTLGDEEIEEESPLVIPSGSIVSINPASTVDLAVDLDVYGMLQIESFNGYNGVLNLNGHTITVRNSGRLINYGTLNKDGGVINSLHSAIVEGVESDERQDATMTWNEFLEGVEQAKENWLETGEKFYYELDRKVTMTGNWFQDNQTDITPDIHVVEGGELIIPKGVTLKASGIKVNGGKITVENGGTLHIYGSMKVLESENGIDGFVHVKKGGTLKNTCFVGVGEYYENIRGGILKVEGTYSGSGIAYFFRDDVIYDEDYNFSFSGVVEGIPTKYWIMPEVNLCSEDPVKNGTALRNVINRYTDMGILGAQIFVGEAVLNNSLHIGPRYEVTFDRLTVNPGAELEVSGFLSCGVVENNGTLIFNKYSENSVGEFIGENLPVNKGAFFGAEAGGIAVTPAVEGIGTMTGSTISINKLDLVNQDTDPVKVNIEVLRHEDAYGYPLQTVTITSSNKKVLDPANIVRTEDGFYELRDLAPGSTTLTITSWASKLGTESRGGEGGKLIGKSVTAKVTIQVVTPKVESITLNLKDDINDTLVSTEEIIAAMKPEAQTLILCPELLDEQGRAIDLTEKTLVWSTTDKAIAAVKANADGTATVTVPANASGYASVSVSVKDQKDKTDAIEFNVQDRTPRLGSNKFDLNPYLAEGAVIDLVESYGNKINSVGVDNAALLVKPDRENGKLQVTARDAGLKKQTIKTTLHIYTQDGTYDMPITVNVKPALPKVTVKQAKKLDLFYNNSETELIITAAGGVEVLYAEMSGTDDFVYDSDVGYMTFGEKLLTEYPVNTKYKIDNKADIIVTLAGYRVPVLVKNFKINTTTSKVSLVARNVETDATSTTINTKLYDAYEICLAVWDKATDEVIDEFSFSFGGEDGLAMKKQTLSMTVQQENWMRPQKVTHAVKVETKLPTVKLSASTVKLSQLASGIESLIHPTSSRDDFQVYYEEAVYKGKDAANAALLEVQAPTEELADFYIRFADEENLPKAGKYKYEVTPYIYGPDDQKISLSKVSFTVQVLKAPTFKLKTNKVTLSSLFTYQTATIAYTLDQDVDIKKIIPEATGNYAEYAPGLDVSWNQETKQITFGLTDKEDPATLTNGSYTYNLTPWVRVDGTETQPMKPVQLKLTLESDKMPTLKAKSKTVAMSSNMAGNQLGCVDVTFTNKTGYSGLYWHGMQWSSDVVEEAFHSDGKIYFALKEGVAPGKYPMTITPHISEEETPFDETKPMNKDSKYIFSLTPFTVTVEVKATKPAVTTKVSGKLDVLDPDSALTYTVTEVSNVQKLMDTWGFVLWDAELKSGVNDNDLFQLEKVESDTSEPTFQIRLANRDGYKTGTKYKVTVTYTVCGYEVDTTYTIKVNQGSVKMAAAAANITQFLSAEEPVRLGVKVNSPADVSPDSIAVVDKSTAKELLTALGLAANQEIELDVSGADAELELEVLRPSALKNGKTYKLVLQVQPEHHAENAKPIKITYKIKVVK